MRHSKSRLVEDADESAPVRLETAPTGELKMGNHKGCPYIGAIPVGVGFPNPLGEETSPLRENR